MSSRNQRHVAKKQAVTDGAATSWEELRRNAERAVAGAPAIAIIEGWKVTHSIHPKLGRHLAASRVSPTASGAVLHQAKEALSMPDSRDDVSFYVSSNNVSHWSWGATLETDAAVPSTSAPGSFLPSEPAALPLPNTTARAPLRGGQLGQLAAVADQIAFVAGSGETPCFKGFEPCPLNCPAAHGQLGSRLPKRSDVGQLKPPSKNRHHRT